MLIQLAFLPQELSPSAQLRAILLQNLLEWWPPFASRSQPRRRKIIIIVQGLATFTSRLSSNFFNRTLTFDGCNTETCVGKKCMFAVTSFTLVQLEAYILALNIHAAFFTRIYKHDPWGLFVNNCVTTKWVWKYSVKLMRVVGIMFGAIVEHSNSGTDCCLNSKDSDARLNDEDHWRK